MAPKPKAVPVLVSALLLFLLLPNQSVESRTLKPSVSKFVQLVQTLEGSVKGQTVQGLNQVKHYLQHYGYYPNDVNVDDDFDETLESAIKLYQKFYGLKVTGLIDAETIKEMTIPRCGNPDIVVDHDHPAKSGSKFHMVAHYSFFRGSPRWTKKRLTYSFIGRAVVPIGQIRQVCASAFSKWARYSGLTFHEVPGGTKSDLTISFQRGYHGDPYPFDGRFNGSENTLAHAFSPQDGRFHYDADENWSTQPSANQFDLETVAVHEIGHLLGLRHSTDRNAIMFPSVGAGIVRRNLGQDDINGIRALYAN